MIQAPLLPNTESPTNSHSASTPDEVGAAADASSVVAPSRPGELPLSGRLDSVPIDRIRPDPDQPRQTPPDPEEFANLIESMRGAGPRQLVPIIVRSAGQDSRDYIIIVDGECRWRAAKEAGRQHMGCVVRMGLDAGDVLELQLMANALRFDLHPLDQAHAFRRLMDEKGINQKQLAERLKITESKVSRALATLKTAASTPPGDSESGDPKPISERQEAVSGPVADFEADHFGSEAPSGFESPDPVTVAEADDGEMSDASAETSEHTELPGSTHEVDVADDPVVDDVPPKAGKGRGRPSVATAVGARKSLAGWIRKQRAGDLSDHVIIDALNDAICDIQGGSH